MAIDGHVRSSDQFQNGYKLVDFLSFFHDDGFFVWFIFYEALTRVYGDGANWAQSDLLTSKLEKLTTRFLGFAFLIVLACFSWFSM